MRKGENNRTNDTANGSTNLYQWRTTNGGRNTYGNRAPKHQAAMTTTGAGPGTTRSMHLLHNDDIPCCRPLQTISEAILPPLVSSSSSPSLVSSPPTHGATANYEDGNNGSSHKHNTDDQNKRNVKTENLNQKQDWFLNTPNSEGFIEMVQDFLWNKFHERREQLQNQQQHLPGEPSRQKAATKKKRKKKKKKKTKNTSEDADEDFEEWPTQAMGASCNDNNAEEWVVEAVETEKTRDVSVAVQRVNAMAKGSLENISAVVEQGNKQIVSSEISQNPSAATRSATAHRSTDTESSNVTDDRDWWIYCYLDRVDRAHSPGLKEQSSSLKMKKFLCALSEKTCFSPGESAAAACCGDDALAGTELVHPYNRSKGTGSSQQQALSRKAQQQQSANTYFHVSQKDLEQVSLQIECNACRSRVTNFLSNCSRIPLLSLDEMCARKGDGRRVANTLLATAIGRNGNGNTEDGDEDPFDYVAMEEGNAVRTTITNNGVKAHQQSDSSQVAHLVLQAVKTPQGQTVGWRIQKEHPQTIDLVENTESIDQDNDAAQYRPCSDDSSGRDRKESQKCGACDMADDSSGRNGKISAQPRQQMVLTEEDVSFLLREFFLLPALSYDTLVGACDQTTLSAEKLQTVTETVDERYSHILEELTQCMKELCGQQEKLSMCDKQMDYGGTNLLDNSGGLSSLSLNDGLDLKSPIVLNEIDGAISGVLEKLLRLILQVTHFYQEVMLQWNETTAGSSATHSSSSSYSHFVPLPSFLLGQVSSIVSLWQVFLYSITRILEATTCYERDLFELADRQGVLKPFFSCPRSRTLLAKVVQEKIKIVLDAIEGVRKKLDEQKDTYATPAKVYRPTFLRSILTQQVLLEVVRTNIAHGQQFSGPTLSSKQLKKLNETCEDVLHEIPESWTKNIRGNSVPQFQEEYDIKREKFERVLGAARQLVHCRSPRENVQELDGSCMDVPLMHISKNGHGLEENFPVLRSQLVPAVEAMIRQWIVKSTTSDAMRTLSTGLDPMKNGEGEQGAGTIMSPKPLIMPLRLVQWMSSPEGQSETQQHKSGCNGADGSLRATCLIMTLSFVWFVDQFNEWQAEVAEQELLRTMGNSDQRPDLFGTRAGPTTQSTGPSKKKTKKKRAKASSSTTSDQIEKQDDETAATSEIKGKILLWGGEGDDTLKERSGLAAGYVAKQSSQDNNETSAPTTPLMVNPFQVLEDEVVMNAKSIDNRGVNDKKRAASGSPEHIAGHSTAHTESPSIADTATSLSPERTDVEEPCVTEDSESSGENGVVKGQNATRDSEDSEPRTGLDSMVPNISAGEQLLDGETVCMNSMGRDGRDVVENTVAGVFDGSKFVAAQTFLLQRLVDVVEGADSDDGFPIIHL